MLRKSILLVALTMAVVSCKKSSSSNPNPSGKDTAYLMKTEVGYTYDASGNRSSDSSVAKWTYDSKGRALSEYRSEFNGQQVDSSSYTYTGNQTIVDDVMYYGGALSLRSHMITFYSAKGFADSTTSTGIYIDVNNGVPTSRNGKTVTVYYNDAYGNDTLDVSYDLTQLPRMPAGFIRKSYNYANGTLSTSQTFRASGIRTDWSQWVDGNIVSDSTWNSDGTLFITQNFTYSNVLSGGFYHYGSTKNLMTTYALNYADPGGNNYTENIAYTFDDANRVSTMTRTYSNQSGHATAVYTYY